MKTAFISLLLVIAGSVHASETRKTLMCRGPLSVVMSTNLAVDKSNSTLPLVNYNDVAISFRPMTEPAGFGEKVLNGQCGFPDRGMTGADGGRIAANVKREAKVEMRQAILNGKFTALEIHIQPYTNVGWERSTGKLITIDVVPQTGGGWQINPRNDNPIYIKWD